MNSLEEIIGNYYLAIDLNGEGDEQARVHIEDLEGRDLGVHVRQLRSGYAVPFLLHREEGWMPGKYELVIDPPARSPELPPYYQLMIFHGYAPIPAEEIQQRCTGLITKVEVQNNATSSPGAVADGDWLTTRMYDLKDPWPDPPPRPKSKGRW